MEYGKIVSDSFNLAWRYPSLWVLGLFAGGANTFNLDLSEMVEWSETDVFGQTMRVPDMAVVPLIGFSLFFGLLMLLITSLSAASVIDSANRTTRGQISVLGRHCRSELIACGVL